MKVEIHEDKKEVKFDPMELQAGTLFVWDEYLVVRIGGGCTFLGTGVTWSNEFLRTHAGCCRPFTGTATISNEVTE